MIRTETPIREQYANFKRADIEKSMIAKARFDDEGNLVDMTDAMRAGIRERAGRTIETYFVGRTEGREQVVAPYAEWSTVRQDVLAPIPIDILETLRKAEATPDGQYLLAAVMATTERRKQYADRLREQLGSEFAVRESGQGVYLRRLQ